MIRPSGRTLALWVPTFVLLIAVIVVTLTIISNNSHRLDKLEESQNQQVITFTFNQGASRFRIVCTEDKSASNIYICATTRVGNSTPTPTRSPGG